MKKYQKEVETAVLEHEERIREQLKETYRSALKEVSACVQKLTEDPENQSRIMRAKYQKQLEADLKEQLRALGDSSVENVRDYLNCIYEDGFLGVVYGCHQEDISILLMVNADQVKKVVEKETADFKFSHRLYRNRDKLVSDVKREISRGIASGMAYRDIAQHLAIASEANLKQAWRIVRTEGHRVQNEAKMDSMKGARAAGAKILKKWDSTVDKRTRPTHRELDGQLRELDEAFVIPSTGAQAMYPGGFGQAKEDIWCRCCLLQIPEWAISEEDQKYSRLAGTVISTKSNTYQKWKKEYKRLTSAPHVSGGRTTQQDIFSLNKMRTEIYERIERSGVDESYAEAFRYYESMAEYEMDGSYGGVMGYFPESDVIRINLDNPGIKYYDMDYVLVHEISHRMDFLQYHSFDSKDFQKAIAEVRKKIYNNLEVIESWFTEDGQYADSFIISDIVGALTNAEIHGNISHTADYWGEDAAHVPLEIFANISAAELLGMNELSEFQKGAIFHELYEAFRKVRR